MNDITYKGNIPYYKDMPCFINGIRLNSIPKIYENGLLGAYYWRDAGAWGSMISEIYPNTFVFTDEWEGLSHLYLKEVQPTTFKDWRNSNTWTTLRCSNVIEALRLEGFEGHEGLKI